MDSLDNIRTVNGNADIVQIDYQKCDNCGLCVSECPTFAIQMDTSEERVRSAPDARNLCLACGHCVAVCLRSAFRLKWFDPDDCLKVRPEMVFSSEQAEYFIRSRRSIRTFRDKPVERSKLKKLVEIAGYAPSAKNKQPWHWLIVDSQKELRRFEGMVIDWMRILIKQEPQFAETIGAPRQVIKWENGESPILRNAPALIVVHADKSWPFSCEDCTLSLSYLDLFTSALDLGACWAGHFYYAANRYPPLTQVLEIPSQNWVYGALVVGYPRPRFFRMPLRRPPRVTWK
ncbi:MAG: nitroreductase family protein [Syntrophaceae bacterium]|nr:nitroreductase family protein [Syntrophaceae bacterium]